MNTLFSFTPKKSLSYARFALKDLFAEANFKVTAKLVTQKYDLTFAKYVTRRLHKLLLSGIMLK
jgi:hypothetical protein